jgi:hypothetical protein
VVIVKIVGEKLEAWAFGHTDPAEKDLFGRSAFNRYYYASFLFVRIMLSEFDESWKKTAHKEIPNILEGALLDRIKTQLKNNLKSGLINESEMNQLKNDAIRAASDLANLLGSAYSVRKVADYEPENHLVINNNSLILNGSSIGAAKKWPDNTQHNCKIIRRVGVKCGLI